MFDTGNKVGAERIGGGQLESPSFPAEAFVGTLDGTVHAIDART